jgi:hypothetical protein
MLSRVKYEAHKKIEEHVRAYLKQGHQIDVGLLAGAIAELDGEIKP